MINFFESNFILFLILLVFFWLIFLSFLFLFHIKDQKRIAKEIQQKKLEGFLAMLSKKGNKLEQDVNELYKYIDQLEKITSQSITKIGIVRYNPFDNTGGDQSFSVALLNSQNNGLIISSLHGREGSRIYSKPIKQGKSQYRLSEEEENAIKQALNNKI